METAEEINKQFCICGRRSNTVPSVRPHCTLCGSSYIYGKESASVYTIELELAKLLLKTDKLEIVHKFAYVPKPVYEEAGRMYAELGFTKEEIAERSFVFEGFRCRRCNKDFSTADTCKAPSVGKTMYTPAANRPICPVNGQPYPEVGTMGRILFPCPDANGKETGDGIYKQFYERVEKKEFGHDAWILWQSHQLVELRIKYLYPLWDRYVAEQIQKEKGKETEYTESFPGFLEDKR